MRQEEVESWKRVAEISRPLSKERIILIIRWVTVIMLMRVTVTKATSTNNNHDYIDGNNEHDKKKKNTLKLFKYVQGGPSPKAPEVA